MNDKKSRKVVQRRSFDLVFEFKYPKIKTEVSSEIYSPEKVKEIKKVVKQISREISVDRTYVDFKDTKYEKTFMNPDGWNYLCKLLCQTDFGKGTSLEQYQYIQDCYEMMVLGYLYQFLEDLEYDISGIDIQIEDGTSFIVEMFEDTQPKNNYPGKWQYWME